MAAILDFFQVALYPILISRPKATFVPNFMLLTQNAQFFHHSAELKRGFRIIEMDIFDQVAPYSLPKLRYLACQWTIIGHISYITFSDQLIRDFVLKLYIVQQYSYNDISIEHL